MCACVLEDVCYAQCAHAYLKMFVLRNMRMRTWRCLFCGICACVLEDVGSAHALLKMFCILDAAYLSSCTFLDCPLHSKVCLPKPLRLIWSNIVIFSTWCRLDEVREANSLVDRMQQVAGRGSNSNCTSSNNNNTRCNLDGPGFDLSIFVLNLCFEIFFLWNFW